MSLNWPPKSPAEVLDYGIRWVDALGTDTIDTSTWAIDSTDLVEDHSSKTANVTTIWLASGEIGGSYVVTNTIITAGGRTFVQAVNIRVVSPTA